MFFAKDWQRINWWPCSTKWRRAKASLSTDLRTRSRKTLVGERRSWEKGSEFSPRSESEISVIDQREVFLLLWTTKWLQISACSASEALLNAYLDDLRDLLPLFPRRIDSSRVVSASVQQNDTTFIHRLQILLQTFEIQPNRLLVIVRVSLDFETWILENWNVVTPSWGGEVDRFRVGIVTGEESTSDTESTSSGEGLSDCDLWERTESYQSTERREMAKNRYSHVLPWEVSNLHRKRE